MFLVPLVLSNNLIMAAVKWLSGNVSSTWLRVALGLLSVATVIVASGLNGTPVDFNQISGIAKALAEALAIGVASHFSFKAISA